MTSDSSIYKDIDESIKNLSRTVNLAKSKKVDFTQSKNLVLIKTKKTDFIKANSGKAEFFAFKDKKKLLILKKSFYHGSDFYGL